jgi:hypothetical protein
MAFPRVLAYDIAGVPAAGKQQITVHGGVTTLVGPNGSGKTQVLRGLKKAVEGVVGGRQVRFLSAGRLAYLERFRSDYDGLRAALRYEEASFGDTNVEARRHAIETAQGDFHTLSVRPDLLIKVTERLRSLFKREMFLEWEGGQLKVRFSAPASGGVPYSVAREASGVLELVALLAALYDDEVGALLIDEPEVSLHPQLQSFMLQEMHKVAGDPATKDRKLVIIATHSTEMIDVRKPEDLASIVFCSNLQENPKQVAPEAEELKGTKLQELLARLGTEHKRAFFCERPVLVEGPSDAIICTGLDRLLDLNLGAGGAQLVPVTGKGQMPPVVKLMRLLGKEPVVLADADAIADGLDLIGIYASEPSVKEAAIEKAHRDASDLARKVYSDFCQRVEHGWHEVAPRAEQHPYYSDYVADGEEKAAAEEAKRRRRATLATLMSMSPKEVQELDNNAEWQELQVRLNSLLDSLENAGCFILRRGTIESYYQFVNQQGSRGKPLAAVQEVRSFSGMAPEEAKERYNDIARALRFAARTEPIDEMRTLRPIVKAVAAGVLDGFSETTTEEELAVCARALIEGKASLFRLRRLESKDGVPELEINLDSSVLNVSGFPVRLRQGCNPNDEIDRQLGR